jgi:hypothetical protein
MKNTINRRSFVQGLFGAVFVGVITKAEADNMDTDTLKRDAALMNLSSLSREQMEQAANDPVDEEMRLVVSLAAQLTNPGSTNEVKCYAAYFLGQLNYRESVPPLLANITLMPTRRTTDFAIPRWFDFPAVEALSHLGNLGVAGALDLLKTTNDPDVRACSLRVLRENLNYPGVAEVILKDTLAIETDANAKQHLQQAIDANKAMA